MAASPTGAAETYREYIGTPGRFSGDLPVGPGSPHRGLGVGAATVFRDARCADSSGGSQPGQVGGGVDRPLRPGCDLGGQPPGEAVVPGDRGECDSRRDTLGCAALGSVIGSRSRHSAGFAGSGGARVRLAGHGSGLPADVASEQEVARLGGTPGYLLP